VRSSYDSLHQLVQRWVHKQGWQSLRSIQEQAIPSLIEANQDAILAASTASGKTEAAFLPILSYLLTHENELKKGCHVLYVAPLKALINDQYQRLQLMVDGMNIKVTPWHGDVSGSKKTKFIVKPDGVLLITPESVESLMVNHGTQLSRLFQGLQFVVIDELHAYIGMERGIQLQSLLHRMDILLRRRVPRVGLSATLGDMGLAAEYLRPGYGKDVNIIESHLDQQSIRLQVRGYCSEPPDLNQTDETNEILEEDELSIAKHLFKTLRGTNNLIFANSRVKVESYADRLRRISEKKRVPIEFLPHHGSLSKEIREFAETEVKKANKPMNIICTSTLEMGIDIGVVESIAQIGSPYSVAAMRQRLGRSGRRGSPATMRTYIREERVTPLSSIDSTLRLNVVQAIAMTELLLEGWCEPPNNTGMQLSTLIQQILSVIAQYGGISTDNLWKMLCKKAPFSHLTQEDFIKLLRCMGKKELIQQASDQTLIHERVGEQIVNHYSFYTAFSTPDEFNLLSAGKRLGSMPIDFPVQEGSFLIFAGQRWKVLRVELENKVIDLLPAKGGKKPKFGGKGGSLHREIRQRMLQVYKRSDVPEFLDNNAQSLLQEGRDYFNQYSLSDKWLLSEGKDVHIFLWESNVVHNTLSALILFFNIEAESSGHIITAIDVDKETLLNALIDIANDEQRSDEELANNVVYKWMSKYDNFLNEELLNKNYASHQFNIDETYKVLNQFIECE